MRIQVNFTKELKLQMFAKGSHRHIYKTTAFPYQNIQVCIVHCTVHVMYVQSYGSSCEMQRLKAGVH